MDIYGRVAKATTVACGHDRVFGERACLARLRAASIKRNLGPRFVVALLPGDKASGTIRARELRHPQLKSRFGDCGR
jgi:hypothetical protein